MDYICCSYKCIKIAKNKKNDRLTEVLSFYSVTLKKIIYMIIYFMFFYLINIEQCIGMHSIRY